MKIVNLKINKRFASLIAAGALVVTLCGCSSRSKLEGETVVLPDDSLNISDIFNKKMIGTYSTSLDDALELSYDNTGLTYNQINEDYSSQLEVVQECSSIERIDSIPGITREFTYQVKEDDSKVKIANDFNRENFGYYPEGITYENIESSSEDPNYLFIGENVTIKVPSFLSTQDKIKAMKALYDASSSIDNSDQFYGNLLKFYYENAIEYVKDDSKIDFCEYTYDLVQLYIQSVAIDAGFTNAEIGDVINNILIQKDESNNYYVVDQTNNNSCYLDDSLSDLLFKAEEIRLNKDADMDQLIQFYKDFSIHILNNKYTIVEKGFFNKNYQFEKIVDVKTK